MFEKIGRLAETAATKISVSRRGFLGRLGQGALTTAGVLGGLLAMSNKAQAGKHDLYVCYYTNKSTRHCAYRNCPTNQQFCGGCPNVLSCCDSCCVLYASAIIGTC